MFSISLIHDITNHIFLNEMPEKSGILFVPGNKTWVVPAFAARLYNEGYARKIIASGKYAANATGVQRTEESKRKFPGEYATESDYLKDVMIKCGVPPQAILQEKESRNLQENAANALQLMSDKKIVYNVGSAIVVALPYMQLRTSLAYKRVFNEADVKINTVPCFMSAPEEVGRDNWYMRESMVINVIDEMDKCREYFNDSRSELLLFRLKKHNNVKTLEDLKAVAKDYFQNFQK